MSDENVRYVRIALALVGSALIAVGPATLLAPDTAASAFGIPATTAETKAYLLASAMRDVALGSFLLAALALRASRRLLAGYVLALAFVAAADATNVAAYTARHGGAWALVVHVGGFIVLAALAWSLRRATGCRSI